MSRVILIHWKHAEGLERALPLRRAGHEVDVRAPENQVGLRKLVDDPPEAFVIDLDRTPSHGRDLALWLRQRKATRRVPIVFVADLGRDGAPVVPASADREDLPGPGGIVVEQVLGGDDGGPGNRRAR